jgi:hypothetical protein
MGSVSPHQTVLDGRPFHWLEDDAYLGWAYLLPSRPMIRRVDTLEIHGTRWGMRKMVIDASIPTAADNAGKKNGDKKRTRRRCFLPVALLNKHPVAADLEVRNGSGTALPVPTKLENMALTAKAFAEIDRRAASWLGAPRDEYRLSQDLQSLMGDVITMQPRDARVCRLEIEQNMVCSAHAWLMPLLKRLEDNFMLWVPIEGVPGSEQRIEITRGDVRAGNPVFPKRRRKDEWFQVQSSIKTVSAEWNAPHRWMRTFRPAAAVADLLVPLGLTPVKFQHEALEANRFSSYHLRVIPPRGLLIRDVKAGKTDEEQWDSEQIDVEPLESGLHCTVQGADTRTGHVHVAMKLNPSRLSSRIMIGLRPGTTTLWALVTVLTAGLLWAFHRKVDELSEPGFHLSIAVAVLLVGPTFASAWTLRDNDRALLRSMLAGTRLLLLGSATLSVATALALAGLRPFDWPLGTTIEWYATASYTIALFITTGWLHARSVTWFFYRDVLTKARWNLLATALLAAGSLAVILHLQDFSIGVSLLFVSGFGFAAIAGNRISVPIGKQSRFPAALAGVAAGVTLGIAGRELGLFNRLIDRGAAHAYGWKAEFLITVIALAAFCRISVRASRESRKRRGIRLSSEKTLPNAAS